MSDHPRHSLSLVIITLLFHQRVRSLFFREAARRGNVLLSRENIPDACIPVYVCVYVLCLPGDFDELLY
jgi:hypothetical protein